MNLLSFLLCLLIVITRLRTTTTADEYLELSTESKPIERGLHRHVVLIAELRPDENEDNITKVSVLATGSIISPLWILTLEKPLKDQDPKTLVVLPGEEIDTVDNKHIQINISSKAKMPESEFPLEKKCMLLRTAEKMTLGGIMQNAPYGLKRSYKRYSHCELVTWTYNAETEKWIKMLTKLDHDCRKGTDFCIKPEPRENFRPCLQKVNAGAALMCDVTLAGLLFGGEKGCDPTDEDLNYAILFLKNLTIRDWLQNGMTLNSTALNYDYEYDMRNFDIDDYSDENGNNVGDVDDKIDRRILLKRWRCAGATSYREQYVLLLAIIFLPNYFFAI